MRYLMLGLGLVLIILGLQTDPYLEGQPHRYEDRGVGLAIVGVVIVAVAVYHIIQHWRHR